MENINKNKLSIKFFLCAKNNLISVETTNDYYIRNNILKKKELNTIIDRIYNYYKKYDIRYVLKSNITENDILQNYLKIRKELSKYSSGLLKKREIIIFNKIDVIKTEEINEKVNYFKRKIKKNIYKISVIQNKGLINLKKILVNNVHRKI